MKGELVGIAVIVVCVISLIAWSLLPYGDMSAPKKCLTLPTAVVEYNSRSVVLNNKLYLCFEQGAEQGMTEVRCVPMEDCPEEKR